MFRRAIRRRHSKHTLIEENYSHRINHYQHVCDDGLHFLPDEIAMARQ